MRYYFNKITNMTFEKAVEKAVSELKKEGFGILTEIDVRETLKKKLGVNFIKYKILGACNPSYAYKALQAEDKIGTMLPCNVIIQELREGKIEIAVIDPVASMKAVNNPQLIDVAKAIKKKLRRVIEII